MSNTFVLFDLLCLFTLFSLLLHFPLKSFSQSLPIGRGGASISFKCPVKHWQTILQRNAKGEISNRLIRSDLKETF